MGRDVGALRPFQVEAERKNTTGWAAKEQRLLQSCHPRQRDFAGDTAVRITALCGRGAGKTTGAKARIVRRMLQTPNARCLYVATTRGHAEELLWEPLKETIADLQIRAHWDETKLKLRFLKNNAQVRLVGCDDKKDIEKHRGLPFHEVIIDEAASHKAQILEWLMFRIIGPRLGDYNGTLCLIGTPGHYLAGPFYEASRTGSEIHRAFEDRDKPEFKDWDGWSHHHWTVEDGAPHVPELASMLAVAQREKRRAGWSDDHPVWVREYLGRWAGDDSENIYKYRVHDEEGSTWNQWDPPRVGPMRMAQLPKGHEWFYVFGIDLGHSDDFSLQVFAHSPTSPDMLHVYEFTATKMYARSIAELLLGRREGGGARTADDPGGVIGQTGWPTGAVADAEGLGGAVLEELAQVYGLPIAKAEKKQKHDAIELCNGDLLDGRIKILKGSKLEAQLLSLQWEIDEYGGVKERKGDKNDCTDAFIYARREALHHFSSEPAALPPIPGSRERINHDMTQKLEQLLHEPETNDFEGLAEGEFQDESWL